MVYSKTVYTYLIDYKTLAYLFLKIQNVFREKKLPFLSQKTTLQFYKKENWDPSSTGFNLWSERNLFKLLIKNPATTNWWYYKVLINFYVVMAVYDGNSIS